MKDEVLKENNMNNKNEKENVIMENKNNGNHKEEINGVRYVNTTHKTFTNMMYGRCNDFLKLNLSTRKVTEYKCDLGPAPDDASKEWGAIYLFPHYLIESPKYRIEPDIQDTDLVDITDICSYNELLTVLIDKNDMSCPGFKRFILDTLDNMLNTVNGCKIPTTIDPERYLSYRKLMTMIQFINKYNKYLNILPYRFKNVLVHILDNNNGECGYYYRYNIATIAENGKVIGNIMKTHLIEKSEVGKTSDYDYRNDNPEYKYDLALNFVTKMSDKIDYKIASHDAFKDDLITNYIYNLRKLVKEFNEKANEIGIEKAWKTKVGFIILKYIDYIAEFRTEDMKPIKLYINEHKRLCFTDRVSKSEISDNFGTFVFNETLPTKQNADKYNPYDFKIEDDSDYITEPGSMIIIFNKNLNN
jgi:hypothetical protein